MNNMKKKPELLKKTGKSSQTLRKFLNNLKENDLHFENKQITQCVFLGVLRLKPVPSVFSNNVPSVSTVESNKSKRIKNTNVNNKELNKNASKKNNINKVLSGKVSKKNPEQVKAAVKKVPIKKPNIKIKLSTKSKIHEEPSTSNGKLTLPSTSSKTVSPDSIIARSTLTLNPITSPTKFNPVQNLFDKLKQRREESQNEAGPSKITSPSIFATETSKSTGTKYKVCKINANGRDSPSCKKQKKSLHKKSHERLLLPSTSSSPITVSDTESTGKKDSDIILLDENNSNSSESSDNGIVEDIILINDDPQPKSTSNENIDECVQITQALPVRENSKELDGCQEVIVIPDEQKQTGRFEGNNNDTEKDEESYLSNKNDVIVIEEVREIRVSPRLRKMEEKAKTVANTEKTIVDEVIIVPDDKRVSDFTTPSKVPDPEGNSKTFPKVQKVDTNKEIPLDVKSELIEDVLIVSDKPRKRKNRLRSPTLLPPMLLNAPMLLRSELAPKKPNYVAERPRVRKPRNKMGDSSTSSKPFVPFVESVKSVEDGSSKTPNKNLVTLEPKKILRLDQESPDPQTASTGCSNESEGLISDEIICLDDTTKNKNTKKLLVAQHKNANNKIEKVQKNCCPQRDNLRSPENKKDDVITLNDDETLKTEAKIEKTKTGHKKSETEVNAHKDDDVVIVKEESKLKEKVSPRLLRSDMSKQRHDEEEKRMSLLVADKTESEVNEIVNLTEEPQINRRVSPRTLRSSIIKEDPATQESIDNTIIIKDEEIPTNNEEQRLSRSEQKIKKLVQKAKLKLHLDLDEIIVVSKKRGRKKKEQSSDRLLRSELSQPTAKDKTPVKTEVEEVVLIHDEPKWKEKPAVVTPKSKAAEAEQIETVNGLEDPKDQVEVQTPRSLRADKPRKSNPVGRPPKRRRSRIVKTEPNTSPLRSEDIQTVPPKENEESLIDLTRVKVERHSHRLRSERAQKELPETRANINNIISAPRLLRSDMTSQKNPQVHSPKTTRARKSPQSKTNTPLQDPPTKVVVIQNELLESPHFNNIDLDDVNSEQNTGIQKRANPKILTSSKKVIVSKKKKKFRKRMNAAKTSMLLRSELAQLKNVPSVVKQVEKRTLRKAKSKVNEVPIKKEILEDVGALEVKTKQSKKKKNTQIEEGGKSISDSKTVEIVDKNSVEVLPSPNVSEKNVDQKEVSPGEVIVTHKENNLKGSHSRKTKKSDLLSKDVIQSSAEVDLVIMEAVCSNPKPVGRRRKNRKKRKLKLSKEESEPLQENPQNIQEEQEMHDTLKKTDITVFDFDESEPEVVPLRLSGTPKKEKAPSSNVTPKSKKQKVAEEPITKVQAKVQLLAIFEETQENTEQNKAKSTPKKKTGKNPANQEAVSCPQNENVKKKRSRQRNSETPRSKQKEDTPDKAGNSSSPLKQTKPNKEEAPTKTRTSNTPSKPVTQPKQNDEGSKKPRTSTSPLKQTTITDMFSVMMKKEKSSVDSIFESAPKNNPVKPREEKNCGEPKTAMPPPKLDRKPPPSNGEDDDEYYEDDSDCESRMEWIPEEYAEYKFKYSAKKMMTYKPIHKCKICLLILPTYYKLSKHKEEHAKKQNPYNCKQCEQSFSNVEDLTAHLRVHKGKHPYMCKKCDVGFWSKKSLDAHTPIHVLRKVKQPNKRFRCDVCAKEFSKLCDMERHTRVHTGEKPCICNICNKRFQQSHNLSKHLLTHLHVKPFHCEICNKQFGRNDVLNRHLLTHSVEKPIKCPLCAKGFIRQSQLNNHTKKNHPDSGKVGENAEFKVAEAK